MTTDLPYRPCVGVMLLNENRQVFAGERIDTPGAWQMPQGGIDKGETPEIAGFRELTEETGIAPNLATLISETVDWIPYELPDHLIGKLWNGRYRGQKQKWLLMQYTGQDSDINIATDHPEFAKWQWMAARDLPQNIVPFKRAVYEQVLDAFAPHLS